LKRIRLLFLLLGIVLIVTGIILSKLPKEATKDTVQTTNNGEVASFSQEPVSIDKQLISLKVISKKDKKPLPPERIIIPALNIDIMVKESKIVNGYWEVFSDSAGFGLGSSYPDEKGNQVIFAHAREGLFLPLRNAKIGQNVLIFTKEKWFEYRISNIKEVLPSQTDVINPSTEEMLTLYTCSGFSDSKRLIISAKRV